MTTIDITAVRAELELHPDGEPISAIWASDTVEALCDEVDRLTRALEAALARDCPRGDDCDLTVAYMAGERRAEDLLRAENERLREALDVMMSFSISDHPDPRGGHSMKAAASAHVEAKRRARAALNGGADD